MTENYRGCYEYLSAQYPEVGGYEFYKELFPDNENSGERHTDFCSRHLTTEIRMFMDCYITLRIPRCCRKTLLTMYSDALHPYHIKRNRKHFRILLKTLWEKNVIIDMIGLNKMRFILKPLQIGRVTI